MSRRMHLLLWLTACSAALPGSPLPALKLRGSPLPALKLRGGGVQQTLDALPHDAKALAASFVVLGGFDKFVQHLAASETISRPAARKTMHVGAGPLFLLCWPLFSNEETARNWAAVGPLALTLKAAAAGSGLIDDPKTVASMSRSGDRRELLRGPALYGAVFVAATMLCWRELSGVLALVALCAGDGAAEIFGASPFGRRSPRLPWCRRKSVVGTLAFFVATTLGGAAFALYFRGLGWWSVPTQPLLRGVAATAAAAALAESFDTGAWDNPVAFAAAVAAARRAFPTD